MGDDDHGDHVDMRGGKASDLFEEGDHIFAMVNCYAQAVAVPARVVVCRACSLVAPPIELRERGEHGYVGRGGRQRRLAHQRRVGQAGAGFNLSLFSGFRLG